VLHFFVKLPPGVGVLQLLPALAGGKLPWMVTQLQCRHSSRVTMVCTAKNQRDGWEGALLNRGAVLRGVWCLIALVPLWVGSQAEGCEVLWGYAV